VSTRILPLFAEIVAILKGMDAEADQPVRGYPTGLWWYGAHCERRCGSNRPRPRTEPWWSRDLAERLTHHTQRAQAEVAYPLHPRLHCDVVVTLPDGGRMWLELKGAWKSWWADQGKAGVFRSYLLDEPSPSRSHTARGDLGKLALIPTEPRGIRAFGLIGFARRDQPMTTEVTELATLAGLDDGTWTHLDATWAGRHDAREHVSVWLWGKAM
jgi:hypothetical protein